MWELDHKEGWRPKNRCFQTMLLEKNLESPLDSKEIKAVNPKGNQSWIFIGKTDAGAPILWPPDAKSQLFGKDADAGKDWRQGEKGMTENKRVGWYHWLNGHEFEQTLADSEGQGSLGCCSPWGHKELDTTEWLKNNNNKTTKSREDLLRADSMPGFYVLYMNCLSLIITKPSKAGILMILLEEGSFGLTELNNKLGHTGTCW